MARSATLLVLNKKKKGAVAKSKGTLSLSAVEGYDCIHVRGTAVECEFSDHETRVRILSRDISLRLRTPALSGTFGLLRFGGTGSIVGVLLGGILSGSGDRRTSPGA